MSHFSSEPSPARILAVSPRLRFWLAYAALVAIGCNLRSPLTAIPSVLENIRADLGLSAPLAGVLTSIPVLCFGLLPPLLSPLIKRLGIDRAVYAALMGSMLGMLIRPWGGVAGLLAGTLVIGVSLALGNIIALLVVARDFARQVHTATGIYTASINIGAMLTIGLTVPLAHSVGWQKALTLWSLLALGAMAIWWLKGRLDPPASEPAPSRGGSTAVAGPLWNRPVVWIITAAFSLHIFAYYALTAWLPAYLVDSGTMSPRDAGFVASSFQIFSLSSALGVPLLARRMSLAGLLVLMGAAWTFAPLWLLIAPGQWYLWSPIGSFAHGGTFILVFMMIMEHAHDIDDNRRISTLVQSVGYVVGATGPVLMGWLHKQTGGWHAGLGLLVVAIFPLVPLGLAMNRWGPRTGQGVHRQDNGDCKLNS